MLCVRILKVRLIGISALDMISRAIHSRENILRRPTQGGKTQGVVKIDLVYGKGPNATPTHRAAAQSEFFAARFFRILGARASPLW